MPTVNFNYSHSLQHQTRSDRLYTMVDIIFFRAAPIFNISASNQRSWRWTAATMSKLRCRVEMVPVREWLVQPQLEADRLAECGPMWTVEKRFSGHASEFKMNRTRPVLATKWHQAPTQNLRLPWEMLFETSFCATWNPQEHALPFLLAIY